MKLAINPFARRHFEAGKPFTFCNLQPEQLLERVKADYAVGNFTVGYRDGTLLVSLRDVSGIFTPVVRITEGNKHLVRSVFVERQEGEQSFLEHHIDAPKAPAVTVQAVLYSREVLAEDGDVSDPAADWELISINAAPDDAEVPMTPFAMARNQLHLKGGTRGYFTGEQFARSVVYWGCHAMATK